MAVDRSGLEILSQAECLDLLAKRQMGRVALSLDALPVILPVSYGLLDDEVVFAIDVGSRSPVLAHETVVAFEVDEVEASGRSGWSVLVVGMAHRIGENDRVRTAASVLDLRPWGSRQAVDLVALATDRVSGRRFTGTLAVA